MSDVDSTTLTGATVQITANYVNGQDILAFVNTANITGTFDAPSGTLTLTGTDTLANYQAALRSVTYANSSNDPSTSARTVSWIANDGSDPSNTATSTITVTAVNDAPDGDRRRHAGLHGEWRGSGGRRGSDRRRFRQHQPRLRHRADHQHYVMGEDVLAFANTANITGSFNAGSGTLTLTGTDTVAKLPGRPPLGDLRQHFPEPPRARRAR